MSKAKPKRPNNASKLDALRRSQQINELLKRSTIESEALQAGGDDRPVGEDHISALLEEDPVEKKLQNSFDADEKKMLNRSKSSKAKKSAPKKKAKGKKSR